MTHRPSGPGVGENGGAHESLVIDKTNALLRKMERGEALNLAKELADLAAAHPEAPAIVARMLGGTDIRNPAPLAEVLAAFCDAGYFPGERIQEDNAEQIDDELWPLITNPETPASRKILAVDILETIGFPVTEREIAEYIPGYLEEAAKQFDEFRESASDSPRDFFDTLRALSLDDSEAGIAITPGELGNLASLGVSIGKKNQAGATFIAAEVACCADMGVRDKRLEEWFSALENMENPRSAWCLNALAEWPMPEALRDRARSGAASLAAAGVKAEAPSIQGRYSHTILTACDGMGSRSVSFLWKAPDHGLDALSLISPVKKVLFLSSSRPSHFSRSE